MSSKSSRNETFPPEEAKNNEATAVAVPDNNTAPFASPSKEKPKHDHQIDKKQMCERYQTPMQMEKPKSIPDESNAGSKETTTKFSNGTEIGNAPGAKEDHPDARFDVKTEGSMDSLAEKEKDFVHYGETGIGVAIMATSCHSGKGGYSREVPDSPSGEMMIRPGAVAVAGPGITSEVEEENFAEDLGITNSTESSLGNSNNSFILRFSAFVVQSVVGKKKIPSTPISDKDRYGPVIDGVVVEDTPNKDTNQTRRSRCIVLLTVLIVMAAISIAIALPSTLSKSKTKEPTENTGSSSLEASVMPSASPTSDRFQLITSTLSSLGIKTFVSPSQRKALVWLVADDPAQIEVDDIANLTDRYALATIYFALGGDSTWINQLNFLSADPVCNWNVFVPGFNSYYEVGDGSFEVEFQYDWFVIGRKGVFCDGENGMVIGIDLASNNMTGTLPEEIGLLKQLRHTSLWRNKIHGSIPSTIYTLNQIEHIFFTENQITGTISPAIGELRNITLLSATANKLTGSIPESIGELTHLVSLVLSFNNLTNTIPSEINRLFEFELDSIFLDNNLLNGSIPLGDGTYSGLKSLSLHNNRLTGTIPETIYTFTKLILLTLAGNALTGTISKSISNLTSLAVLDLSSNLLDGNIPPSIGNISELEMLYLHDNRLTGTLPDTLGSLANLRILTVSNNSLIGTIPMTVAQAPHLMANFHFNNFNGSIDFLCDQKPHFVAADCYGNTPKVLCSCCDGCCSDDDGCFGPGGCKYISADSFLCV